MCQHCIEHAGSAKRWYLNIEALNEKNADVEWIKKYHTEYSEINIVKPKEEGINHIREVVKHRKGQVVLFEEAVKLCKAVEKIGGPESMIATFCPCRHLRGGFISEPFCIAWGVSMNFKKAYINKLPQRFKKKIIYPFTVDDANELFKEWEIKNKVIHGVFGFGKDKPYIGVICNCEMPYCHPMKQRMKYDIPESYLKSHYVVSVNTNKCKGCGNCQMHCQFGAIRLTDRGFAVVNSINCFGCGVCRSTCEGDAIKMVERENIPLLKERW